MNAIIKLDQEVWHLLPYIAGDPSFGYSLNPFVI